MEEEEEEEQQQQQQTKNARAAHARAAKGNGRVMSVLLPVLLVSLRDVSVVVVMLVLLPAVAAGDMSSVGVVAGWSVGTPFGANGPGERPCWPEKFFTVGRRVGRLGLACVSVGVPACVCVLRVCVCVAVRALACVCMCVCL